MQDLNDLQHFARVVRHGGFSAASRRRRAQVAAQHKLVAQPERGIRLIERSTRSIRGEQGGAKD